MSDAARTKRGDALILIAAVIWGFAFYFQKTAMDHIGPLLFLGLRGLVPAAVLLPFAWIERLRRGDGRRESAAAGSVVPIALLGGLIFFLAAAAQQFGIVTATVTNTGFLTGLYVVATPFVYWVVRRRSPSGIVWSAVLLSFCGAWALGGGSVNGFSRGDALVTAAVLGWAALIVTTGESARFARPLTYTFIQFVVVGVLGLVSAAIFEAIDVRAIVAASASILYVGVLSSALTFGLMAVALQHVPAPRASVMLSLETLFAAIAGYLLLGERLTPTGWAGALLIVSAVVLIRWRET